MGSNEWSYWGLFGFSAFAAISWIHDFRIPGYIFAGILAFCLFVAFFGWMCEMLKSFMTEEIVIPDEDAQKEWLPDYERENENNPIDPEVAHKNIVMGAPSDKGNKA